MKKLIYTIMCCFMVLGVMTSCDSKKSSNDTLNDSDSIVTDTLMVDSVTIDSVD